MGSHFLLKVGDHLMDPAILHFLPILYKGIALESVGFWYLLNKWVIRCNRNSHRHGFQRFVWKNLNKYPGVHGKGAFVDFWKFWSNFKGSLTLSTLFLFFLVFSFLLIGCMAWTHSLKVAMVRTFSYAIPIWYMQMSIGKDLQYHIRMQTLIDW